MFPILAEILDRRKTRRLAAVLKMGSEKTDDFCILRR
jgi:hypothetical protein